MSTTTPIQNILPISQKQALQFSVLNSIDKRLCLKPTSSSCFPSQKSRVTSKKVGFLSAPRCAHSPRARGDSLPLDDGDEWQRVFNSIPISSPFERNNKQLLKLLSSLLGFLGPQIEFVIIPKMLNGMDVGINWSLAWNKTYPSFGKGLSFYMLHKYEGKMRIRNVGMEIVPLAHIETLRLKLMEFLLPISYHISLLKNLDGKQRFAIMYCSFILLLIAAVSLCL